MDGSVEALGRVRGWWDSGGGERKGGAGPKHDVFTLPFILSSLSFPPSLPLSLTLPKNNKTRGRSDVHGRLVEV